MLQVIPNLIEGTVIKRPSKHIKSPPYVADVCINDDDNEDVLVYSPSLGCCEFLIQPKQAVIGICFYD